MIDTKWLKCYVRRVNDFKEDFLMSLSTLNNIRTIRKEAREISFEIFEEILEKMKQVHEELLADQLEIEEKRAKKLALMEQFREMLAAEGIEGISITEIADGVAAPAAKKGKGAKGDKRGAVERKYAYKDENGKEVLWSGRGRLPKPVEEAMKKGAKKEDFLIKKED
ncbi:MULTISPECIES: H-NS family histone-like protein [Enterobacterales]|jgi:DNA-binding protein H-NS|uniref:H-NS family histone-like protein n=1 Tax=Enterobacterales TaxID=91347 RepID=UPI000A633FBF|nr:MULTISPECIES: H-NS family nucleoid-associated regulatory protein [Enterobacteriaceae]MDO1209933.1 H-NS family nucleoid-associated regulatory protein [Salmonella enterica subsp. enterica serovar Bredeney]MDO1237857.1 H-NS family nucleoid-associated regulatory protein [Salmonella enterica subsp. enterica serovar Bredeney]MDO1242786.1 H-NS family nucleoid-associated regulatory protein [Salmonella enterica subsp. enterica serovar Bredeney]MDO1279169.1 H-NS family nucleoid-associated regulatory p